MTAAAARGTGLQAIECSPPTRNGATRRTARGYASGKQDYLRRLRKIEGQVRGLQKMIEPTPGALMSLPKSPRPPGPCRR
jgi:hypothetical protein